MSSTAEILQFPAIEQREERLVADTDNGFMRLANSITDALLESNLTERQMKVILAVMRKTYGFNKPFDRLTNTQIAAMTRIHHTHVCTAKNELLERGFLVMSGRLIGINKVVSDWNNDISQGSKTLAKPANKSLAELANAHSLSQLNTKDTIQKTERQDPPRAPKGETGKEFSEQVLAEAKQVLEYYNELTDGSCRSAEPFAMLLTETKSRSAYTLQDLQLVVRWVVQTWKRRNNTVAKPTNICRVNRFDGYLSDAESWQKTCVDIDCQAVIDAYNDVTAGRMAPADLYRDRSIAIRELASHLAKQTVDGFRAYFAAFLADAREYHFGGPDGLGWRADFDFLMKPVTLRKVREGTL